MRLIEKNQNIVRGDSLLIEKPFIFVLKSNLKNERCDQCFVRGKLLRCSGCQYVQYCNRECQKAAWLDHKTECSCLKKISPRIVPDAARLMARIIFKLKRGGDQERGYFLKGRFRLFKDLMSHYSDIKKDEKRMEHFTSLYAVLATYIGEENIPNTAELMGIYGRMVVNGFNILDPEMNSIGTGIYLAASVLDHSCTPNAVAVFHGTTLSIRAVADIPLFDWSKAFISYIDLLNTPADRQQDLIGTYYFLCDCTRCKDVEELNLMNSVLCPVSNCCGPIPIGTKLSGDGEVTVSCPTCKEHVKQERIHQFVETSEFVNMQLQTMKDMAYKDVCTFCLKKTDGLFHPLNLQQVKLLDSAFESSIVANQWEDAKKYGSMAIPGYKRYYGIFHPLYGIHLLKLGKINLYLECLSEAFSLLKEADKVLRVTHGVDHQLYKEEFIPIFMQTKAAVNA